MTEQLEQIRDAVADPARGYHLIRSLYSEEQVDAYRERCRAFLDTGPVLHTRITNEQMPDYVHPRSHDFAQRTWRIYQFLHNHKGDATADFLTSALKLRDRIEQRWQHEPAYRAVREALQDYVIVTYYVADFGMLPPHRDYAGPCPHPLLQFWVALSQPGKDYRDGNLVLFPREAEPLHLEADLDIQKGDGVVFDKSLLHRVDVTAAAGPGALGRWTVLIGARASRAPALQSRVKRLLYGERLYPTLKRGKNALLKLPGLSRGQ